MSDSATTNFPTMGEDIASAVVNISGAGATSRYTQPVARKNTQSGDPASGGKANKGQTVIRHANGPACTIVAKIAYPNAEGANQTLRNLRRVAGPGFRNARGAAENTGNV